MNLACLEVKGNEDKSSIEKDSHSVEVLTDVLGLTADNLETLICTKSIIDPSTKKKISQNLSETGADNNKGTLAKVIYDKLFDWIVSRLNVEIKKPRTGLASKYRSIGILDIFGFEIFEINSFEQLCINFTNERLQHVFNSQLFDIEMKLYESESIGFDSVAYEDNSHIIDIVNGRPQCVFGFLDEQCKFAGGTDLKFLERVQNTLGKRRGFLPGPKIKSNVFGIAHFAGDVFYDVTNFVEKNRNSKNRDLDEIMSGSSIGFISSLFSEAEEKSGKSKGESSQSVSSQFLGQLKELVEELNNSASLYIRCIKPNQIMSPGVFESEIVCKQLRCAGMLEAIRIRKCGYPIRRPFESFCKIYKLLLIRFGVKLGNPKQAVEAFIKALDKEGIFRLSDNFIQVGKTRVFMKELVKTKLDSMLEESLSIFVTKIQRAFRRHKLAKVISQRVASRAKIQRWWKGVYCRILAQRRKMLELSSIVKMQRLFRAKLISYHTKVLVEKFRSSRPKPGSSKTESDKPTARKEPTSASNRGAKHDFIDKFSQAMKPEWSSGEGYQMIGQPKQEMDVSQEIFDEVESHPKYIQLEIEVQRLRKELEISHSKQLSSSNGGSQGSLRVMKTVGGSSS